MFHQQTEVAGRIQAILTSAVLLLQNCRRTLVYAIIVY